MWRAKQSSPARPPVSSRPALVSIAPAKQSVHGATIEEPMESHDLVEDTRCLAGTAPPSSKPRHVHRWKDDQGVVHFSDRAPTTKGQSEIVALMDVPAIEVDVETRDADLPPHAKSAAIADAVAIGKILRSVLGVKVEDGLHLKVIFAGSDAAFRRAAPGVSTNSGAYISAQRRIVVRTRQRPSDTLAVMKHEITHALLHEWVGRPPKALNEGLAEYFERLQVQGMGGVVNPVHYQRQMRRNAPTAQIELAMRRLLSATSTEFQGDDRDTYYTHALALASTLMASPQGRHALSRLLHEQRQQTCDPIDLSARLNALWPGGLSGLARHWASHQQTQALAVHAY